MNIITRPDANEYAPYHTQYIRQIHEDDVWPVLQGQAEELTTVFAGMADARGNYAYAPEKWTIKEVLGHVSDCERIFGYRMLRIARGDRTPIEGFEQDDYVKTSNANARTIGSLLEDIDLARRANIAMLAGLEDSALTRIGTASSKNVSVRALAYIAAGHVRHHLAILKERYLA